MKQITYIVIACTIVLLGSCELDYSEGTVYSKEEMFAMRAKGIDRMVWGIYGRIVLGKALQFINFTMGLGVLYVLTQMLGDIIIPLLGKQTYF